ncbi:MAG TPA: hypothetical protein VHL78_10685 [Actinomycetota bacterium]|nr:hypothetical protein [Actinomycetota bacterium]
MPRWAKVAWVITILVVLAFLISLVAGVRHGPGLHRPPEGGAGGAVPEPAAVAAP